MPLHMLGAKSATLTLVLLKDAEKQTWDSLFYSTLTWFANCAIILRYVSIPAMTKVTSGCVNAPVRTSAIFIFTLVNIYVKGTKIILA